MSCNHMKRRIRSPAAALFYIGTFASFSQIAEAQTVSLDLLGRIAVLEQSATGTSSSLLGLRADTTANANLLQSQTTRLSALGSDVVTLRTGLGTLGSGLDATTTRLGRAVADIATLRTDVDDLKSIIGDGGALGVIDINGPADLGELLGTVGRQGAAITVNARDIASVKVGIGSLQSSDIEQDGRLDDHERRISRNTRDIAADRAVLGDHDKRITRNTQDIAEDRLVLGDHERRISRNTNDIAANSSAIADLQSRMVNDFAGIDSELRSQDRRIDKATEGVAMALAMKSPAVPEDKEFALSGSFGAFEGRTALAVAGGIRANEFVQFDAGLAVGLDSGSIGGRAGATLAW